ncbi:MAG: nucleotidyltransferase domain-containing protein [Ruminococcaceae bacterium]|nr:nucleotidyltransferase domain-containing protein [Oscillospiraceae bacterium]
MCTKNQIDEILLKIATESKNIFGEALDSVILFGSYARGDFDEESDIDILMLVDLPSDVLMNYRERIDSLCGTLLLEYGIVVSAIEKDLETYNKYSQVLPFYKNIARDGVKIA